MICPHCSAKLSDDVSPGIVAQCPKCGGTFQTPTTGGTFQTPTVPELQISTRSSASRSDRHLSPRSARSSQEGISTILLIGILVLSGISVAMDCVRESRYQRARREFQKISKDVRNLKLPDLSELVD